jgi:hypothetical protein
LDKSANVVRTGASRARVGLRFQRDITGDGENVKLEFVTRLCAPGPRNPAPEPPDVAVEEVVGRSPVSVRRAAANMDLPSKWAAVCPKLTDSPVRLSL